MKDELDNLPGLIAGRVRAFRQRLGISQVDLARRVGIHIPAMCAIEAGKHVPTGRVLYHLARELKASVDSILGLAPPPGYVETMRHSSTTTRGATLLPALGTDDPGPEAVELADELSRAVLSLEDLCGARKRAMVPLHLPFDADERGVERLVSQVRHLLGVSHAVVFDHVELMENAGFRIIFCDLPNGCQSLACHDYPNDNAFFFIDNNLNAERQLFRLFFELARVYWLTRGLLSPDAGAGDLDELHFARKFAALFLMPESAVRSTVSQLGISPDSWSFELLLRIKHRFGVSAESFAIRLEELSLIDPKLSDTHKQRIRGHYKKTCFAEPDGSRRIISANGRLGDLILNASARPGAASEAKHLAAILAARGAQGLEPPPPKSVHAPPPLKKKSRPATATKP